MVQRRLKSFVLVTLLLGLLSGCGFQLRGSADLQGLKSVRIDTGSTILRDELAVFLEDGGVVLVDDKKAQVDAVLSAYDENYQRRVLSVDSNTGKAREYELAYTVKFNLVDGDGEALVSEQRVRLVRDFVFDEDAVIGKSREEDVLRREMRRDAVQHILRRLTAMLRK
tara:strand:+ start:3506 stop:4009 length:504 start_codon:yes stop_codon:yes gene_type:complete